AAPRVGDPDAAGPLGDARDRPGVDRGSGEVVAVDRGTTDTGEEAAGGDVAVVVVDVVDAEGAHLVARGDELGPDDSGEPDQRGRGARPRLIGHCRLLGGPCRARFRTPPRAPGSRPPGRAQ